jgi:hypothetical protein
MHSVRADQDFSDPHFTRVVTAGRRRPSSRLVTNYWADGSFTPEDRVAAVSGGLGSGERFSTSYGGDLRATGATGGRLRPDGTIMPRNVLVGDPIHRGTGDRDRSRRPIAQSP